MSERSLSELFLQHLSPPNSEHFQAFPQLEQSLQKAIDLARQTWPTVTMPVNDYIAFLAARLEERPALPEEFLARRLEDLYLVCGCLQKVPEAAIAFEQTILTKIEGQLHSVLKNPVVVSDLKQSLLQELIITDDTTPPKIASYSGLSDLRHWTAVIAMRQAINLLHRSKKEYPLEERDLNRIAIGQEDPELDYLKTYYHQEFNTAFQRSLASLSCKERNLLRNYLLENLTLDELGMVYKVHRVSIYRWLTKVRQKLLKRTRLFLMQHLKVDPPEFESIMRLIQSQLYVSIRIHLDKNAE